MSEHVIPAGKKSYRVTINGNLMTGDTFGCKDIIKTHFEGKWDASKKAWVVNLDRVQYWTGTKIKPAPATAPVPASQFTTNWMNPDGSLAEDY